MDSDNRFTGASDPVKAGTHAFQGRAFGYVTYFGATRIKLSDHSEWVVPGDAARVYMPLLEVSKENQKPVLLAVDQRTRSVGMVFPTMHGAPQLMGESADGQQLLVRLPPSPRVFRLRKDRLWFNDVKVDILKAQGQPLAASPATFWTAFDSVTSEIVAVLPSAI